MRLSKVFTLSCYLVSFVAHAQDDVTITDVTASSFAPAPSYKVQARISHPKRVAIFAPYATVNGQQMVMTGGGGGLWSATYSARNACPEKLRYRFDVRYVTLSGEVR